MLVAVYAYALQLYYDFSGYTDIAIGSALLLGIKLPPNFDMPYAAANIADFWRRWHISFSNWLRDYLYFSLPGLRSRWKIFAYLNLVITMVLGGLWHGVSWNFAIWGLLHGVALAVTRAWQTWRGRRPAPAAWKRVAGHFFHRAVRLPHLDLFPRSRSGWRVHHPGPHRLADLRHRQHHADAGRRDGAGHAGTLFPQEVVFAGAGTLQRGALLRAGRGHGARAGRHRIAHGTRRRAVRLFEVLTDAGVPLQTRLSRSSPSSGCSWPFPRVSRDLRSLDRATVRPSWISRRNAWRRARFRTPPLHSWPTPRLVDPAGDLARFYAALERTERRDPPGAITRIVHYGDSPTTADMITGDVRLLLQRRFGDAGHGFSLVAKPWAWYEHRDVGLRGQDWTITAASMPGKNDGLFGLGGVSFQSSAGSSRLVLRDPAHTGAEVAYLKQPGGGSFSFTADGVALGSVPTDAPARAAGFAHFRLPAAGAHAIEIHANGAGPVRLFGIILEKKGPGISYDSLGVERRARGTAGP